ncbi:MAG: hypothetical protein AMJ84_04805 [Acidithiobacillales bacterium SM23_46]|nr:MAG: hypothetical protein AMJ84_04805 [Acidithiobacillales bacterium SM23_46]
MELEGSLKAFSLPEILQFLAMGKLTGTLMVRHDHQGIDLTIHQGRIVSSSTFDQARRLGQMLIYRRLICRSDLDEVLYEQRTTHPDRMVGQLLVDRELITLDDLRQVVKAQLEEEIWELFSWESGEFRFEHHAESDIKDVLVEIEIEPLIIEGTRRIDEWKAIIRNLRGDKMVPGLNPWKPEERADLSLTVPEWQVLSFINGFFSIGSIAMRIGIGRFETYRILNSFLATGIVYIKEDPWAKRDEEQAAEEPAEAEKGAPEGRAAARRLSLFAKKRASEVDLAFDRAEKFSTPLGLVARFIDLVVQACFAHRDFSFAAGDECFLDRAWSSIAMEYPLADPVRVGDNQVDVRPLERYLEMGGIVNATLRAYEDAIEALRRLYGTVATVFAQRMGERAYERVVQTLEAEWLPGTQIEQPRDFDFAKFLSRSLPLAEGER